MHVWTVASVCSALPSVITPNFTLHRSLKLGCCDIHGGPRLTGAVHVHSNPLCACSSWAAATCTLGSPVVHVSEYESVCACLACLVAALQFNAGSAGGASVIAGQAFLNTNAAAASAMLTFMLMVSGGYHWDPGFVG